MNFLDPIVIGVFIIIGIFTFLIFVHKQWWLLFALVLVTIFLNYPVGFKILGQPLTTQKIGLMVAFCLVFPALCIEKIPLSRIKTPLTLPLLLLIISALASSLKSKDLGESYERIITLFLIFLALHIIYILIVFSNPKRIKQVILFGIPMTLIILLGVAIYQFIMKGELIGRMTGTFSNPNELGGMILMALPLILAVVELGNGKLKWIGIPCAFICITAIYLTYSRGTYLVIPALFSIVIIGNLFATTDKKELTNKKGLWLIPLIILAGLILYYVLPPSFLEYGILRYRSVFANGGLNVENDGSIYRRYNAIWVALGLIKKNIFLGVGPGAFPLYWSATENTYINVLVEMGLFGFSVFALYFLVYWKC